MEKQRPGSAGGRQQTGRAGAGLIAATALLFLLAAFLPGPRLWTVFPAATLLFSALLLRDFPAVLFTVFCACFIAGPLLHPALRGWPFHLLAPTVLSFVAALALPRLRPSLAWLRPGRLDFPVTAGIVAVSVVSAGALYAWYRLLTPDLSVHLSHIPSMPAWMLPLAGLGFGCGNAALEEFAFRGLIMQALESAFGPGWVALAGQAVLFGSLHYRGGFPNLGWGLAMTSVYGIMLGVLRRRSQGMLAPWLAHFFADSAIFIILVFGMQGVAPR